jgi:hypothetical protein
MNFGPPAGLEESQCRTIPGFIGQVARGSVEGSTLVITRWLPSPEELEDLNAGRGIFISFLGGLPPHLLTTSFEAATNLA